MVLRYEGWKVATATNGATAIEKASASKPDMVVLDVMLPDMSGLQVLAELHAIRPELPVLLLTAKDTLEDRIAELSQAATAASPNRSVSRRWCSTTRAAAPDRLWHRFQQCATRRRGFGAGRGQSRGQARRR